MLDYFEAKELKNSPKAKYKDKKFTTTTIKGGFSDTYSLFLLSYKTKDKNYTIVGISGSIHFDNNIEKCESERDKIFDELKNIFINAKWRDGIYKNSIKNQIESITSRVMYLNDGSAAIVRCRKYFKEWKVKNNFKDDLNVTLYKKEFLDWLNTKAYK